jgi:4-amino-4-deoxy-L-arabinose transferase-like glycosyltransferase
MRRFHPLSWLVPLVVALPLLLWHVAEPWTGSYDANGAIFGTVARNYLRYGLAGTRGWQVTNGGQAGRADFVVYAHHPPALPMTIALSFAVFGEHEWAARLVAILFTLGSAALVAWLGCELAGAWAGGLAGLAFALQPMVAFYGRMPDHEAPAMFFALLTACAYVRWHGSSERRWLVLASAAAGFGVLYGWIVLVLPWLLLVHAYLVRGRWRAVLWPCGAALVAFACVLAHIALLEGGLEGLWGALRHRTGSQAFDTGGTAMFSPADLLRRQAAYFSLAYSWVAAALVPLWLLGFGRRRRPEALLVVALILFGLANILGFPQGAYVHIYYQFYLAAPLALAAGLVLADFVRGRLAWLAALILGAMAVQGVLRLQVFHDTYADPHPAYAKQFALAPKLRGRTEPTDKVLLVWDLPASFRQLTWEADRHITVAATETEARSLAAKRPFDAQFVVEDAGGEVDLRPWSAPVPPPGR